MGTNFSSGNSIYVQTNKPSYVAGEAVSGTVFLNIVQPVVSKGIFLKVKGYERTRWEQKKTRMVEEGLNDDGSAKLVQQEYIEEHKGERHFFKVRCPLYAFGGPMVPGQWSFPFAFNLPEDLPGVFNESGERWGVKYHGRVYYKIKAECDVAGMFKSDIKHKQKLIVHERVMTALQPVTGENTSNVMVCCCINKGSANMKTHFDKNCYIPGERAQIICEVRNNSTVGFKHITVKLMRRIKLKADHHQELNQVEEVYVEKYPGVEANSEAVGENARQVPLPLNHRHHGTIEPETHGHLVHCEYWVDVECDIPMAPDIEIHMPIHIYEIGRAHV